MRKLLSMALSLCIGLSMLTGCAGKNSEAAYNTNVTTPAVEILTSSNITSSDSGASVPVMAAPARSTMSSDGVITLANSSTLNENSNGFVKMSSKKVVKYSKKKTTTNKKSKKQKKTPTKAPTATPSPTDPSITKYVALTFDDGPNTVTTPQVLDKLEKYGIVASFFLIGQNLNDDVIPVMQRQLSLGCEINNHSWTHPNMCNMSKKEIVKEFKDTSDKIHDMVGVYPKFFRPPYIATSANMYENIDVPFICGIGCNDWDPSVTAKDRVDTILKNVKDGDIILMHDAYGNDLTVEALDTIIPTMQKWGYKFVTVSQLFEKKKVDPNLEYKLWTNVLE